MNMGIFNNSRKKNVAEFSKLSEKDIQEKLYGRYSPASIL